MEIAGKIAGSISHGLLVLVGMEDADGPEDIGWLAGKVVNLRIFNDAHGVMNISVKEAGGGVLVVSQFTLHASTRNGNRPGYSRAAKPDTALPLYRQFIAEVGKQLGRSVQTGEFGADMQVRLVNDGPVTIVIDTKNRV